LSDAKQVGWLAYECYTREIPVKFLNEMQLKNINLQILLMLCSAFFDIFSTSDDMLLTFLDIFAVYAVLNLTFYAAVYTFFLVGYYWLLNLHKSKEDLFKEFQPDDEGKLSTFWVVERTTDNSIVACVGYSTVLTPIYDDVIKREEITNPIELKRMLVKKNFRRRGLAKRLLQIVLDDVISKRSQTHNDHEDMLLCVTEYSEAAVNFYRQNKFQEVLRMRNFIFPMFPYDIIAMRKAIPYK